MLREYYVDELNEKKLFSDAAITASLTLDPLRAERLPDLTNLGADPALGLKRILQDLCRNSEAGCDRMVIMTLGFLVSNLDPNTSLLTADMLKELEIGTSGKFGGIGMVVNPKDGKYVVTAAIAGSPAQKAGIKAGDVVLEIDGVDVTGLPLMDVLKKVRGPAGSLIHIKFLDPIAGKPKQIKLQRRIIKIPPVKSALLNGDIAYLRILNFQETAPKEVASALTALYRQTRGNLGGLILDLRDNPGGLFGEAIQVAGMLIPYGKITSIIGRNAKLNKEFKAEGQTNFPEIPIVVLINKGTASASEILTGALQGRPNVLVMGERSFGKASVQAVFPLKNGMAVRITTAHYYTADGRNIDGKGLEPDVSLPDPHGERGETLSLDQLDRDPWVRQALERLEQEPEERFSFPQLY
jgi:carboxyl-terminal processing protease